MHVVGMKAERLSVFISNPFILKMKMSYKQNTGRLKSILYKQIH